MEVSDCLFSQDDQTVLLFVDVLDAWYYTYFIYDVIVTESVPYYFFACILFHVSFLVWYEIVRDQAWLWQQSFVMNRMVFLN